jgi:hypothetical protein
VTILSLLFVPTVTFYTFYTRSRGACAVDNSRIHQVSVRAPQSYPAHSLDCEMPRRRKNVSQRKDAPAEAAPPAASAASSGSASSSSASSSSHSAAAAVRTKAATVASAHALRVQIDAAATAAQAKLTPLLKSRGAARAASSDGGRAMDEAKHGRDDRQKQIDSLNQNMYGLALFPRLLDSALEALASDGREFIEDMRRSQQQVRTHRQKRRWRNRARNEYINSRCCVMHHRPLLSPSLVQTNTPMSAAAAATTSRAMAAGLRIRVEVGMKVAEGEMHALIGALAEYHLAAKSSCALKRASFDQRVAVSTSATETAQYFAEEQRDARAVEQENEFRTREIELLRFTSEGLSLYLCKGMVDGALCECTPQVRHFLECVSVFKEGREVSLHALHRQICVIICVGARGRLLTPACRYLSFPHRLLQAGAFLAAAEAVEASSAAGRAAHQR